MFSLHCLEMKSEIRQALVFIGGYVDFSLRKLPNAPELSCECSFLLTKERVWTVGA